MNEVVFADERPIPCAPSAGRWVSRRSMGGARPILSFVAALGMVGACTGVDAMTGGASAGTSTAPTSTGDGSATTTWAETSEGPSSGTDEESSGVGGTSTSSTSSTSGTSGTSGMSTSGTSGTSTSGTSGSSTSTTTDGDFRWDGIPGGLVGCTFDAPPGTDVAGESGLGPFVSSRAYFGLITSRCRRGLDHFDRPSAVSFPTSSDDSRVDIASIYGSGEVPYEGRSQAVRRV